MKLKLLVLFLLVFAAIGQTIFLNIDAKNNFSSENSTKSYIQSSKESLDTTPTQKPEVVVTIRHHDSEITNQNVNMNVENKKIISAKPKVIKTSEKAGKEKEFICQKAKEAAKKRKRRIAGSNLAKNSTIQNP